MERLQVPATTVQRLPAYLRCLLEAQSQNIPIISSGQIAEMVGTNAAQVRKDLSYLGELGTRGIGYDVADLIGHMSRWLGITEQRRVAIVGYGRLGGALQSYSGFRDRGFEIVAVFDADPAKVGLQVNGLAVQSVDELESTLIERAVEIVVIATPASASQDVADRVVHAGVKAILNLAPMRLDVPEDVALRQVCLSTDLQILAYHLTRSGE